MFRISGRLLQSLPIAATVTFALLAPAQAANEESGPLQGLIGLFQHQAQAQPVSRDRIESESLPPPGFATPNGAPPMAVPQTGHQFGAPAATAAQPDPNSQAMRPPTNIGSAPAGSAAPPVNETVMSLPPDDQPEQGQPAELAPNLKRQMVDFKSTEPAGTIVVDTANTYLYLVLGGGKALRYGVRVGREGFTWTGTERVSKMAEWPDWHPPVEMIERQPYLPRFMAGGPGNPLGARAMYLGKTLYRIHGTNQPSTIGKYVSSGCVGMLNEDVEDLFSRVQVGTRVVVLPGKAPAETVANAGAPPPANPMAPPPGKPVPGPATAAAPAILSPTLGPDGRPLPQSR